MVAPATPWHESTRGAHVPSQPPAAILNPTPTSLPTSSLWVVPEHRLLSALLCASNLALVIYFTYGNIHYLFSQVFFFLKDKAEFLIFLNLFWEPWTWVRTFNPFTFSYILIPLCVWVFSPSSVGFITLSICQGSIHPICSLTVFLTFLFILLVKTFCF